MLTSDELFNQRGTTGTIGDRSDDYEETDDEYDDGTDDTDEQSYSDGIYRRRNFGRRQKPYNMPVTPLPHVYCMSYRFEIM